ncbi:hypothetical protein EV690_1299 [Celerinatantimonas diazotrophica]|uniref:Uncharacterized protein n=1 Tax=Celerinatantimonas diazotrophica TaxID=412034 RepID=A0A4V2PR68_9GAMM|nr:hypothetical protein EV690_1299 [Celerinatantimonas diazotrophica]CAG9298327.1 hypothetical protein CEDIAZO_03527 [Celerinatantimonas diazotrophica]
MSRETKNTLKEVALLAALFSATSAVVFVDVLSWV